MIRVLFVCLGNICRSPIAEGVFRDRVENTGLARHIECDSAGTAGYHTGELADSRMRAVAIANGITLTHRARQFKEHDFDRFDYIVAMDESNHSFIEKMNGRLAGSNSLSERLYLYRSFDPDRQGANNVPDPYYGGQADFEEVFHIVQRCGAGFLDFLIEKHQLK